jgi:cytolysin-activating lysine-acyltransferase
MAKTLQSASLEPVEMEPLLPEGGSDTAEMKKGQAKKGASRKGPTSRSSGGTPAEGAQAQGAKAKPSPEQLLRLAFARASQVFGQVVSLFMQSPQHRHLLLSDLEWRVIPPIALQQYRLVQHKNTPAGFISWALVDEATEQRLQQPDFRLRPQDWNNGERVWVVDIVAPAAQREMLIGKVKAELFEGREVGIRIATAAGARGSEAAS